MYTSLREISEEKTSANHMESSQKYTKMLCSKMCPVMVNIFVEMYKEAINRSGGRRDYTVKLFIVLLEEVENWNNTIIAQHAREFESRCSYFSDLLAAVFICYVNILARAIRKKSDDGKKLDVQLPSNSDFIHRCLTNAAELFRSRVTFFREENEHTRYEKIYDVCCMAVEKTLDDLVPIQHILRTYIDSNSVFKMGSEEDEPEDSPEPEPAAEPEPEPEETKNIPVKPEHTNPTLFDDAAEERNKTMGIH